MESEEGEYKIRRLYLRSRLQQTLRIASHRNASHRLPTQYNNTTFSTHRIASHHIASHRIAFNRLYTSHRIASHRIASPFNAIQQHNILQSMKKIWASSIMKRKKKNKERRKIKKEIGMGLLQTS
jgi:hypothetical protein